MNSNTENNLFKPYILGSVPYKGSSTREEGGRVFYKLSSNENMLGPSPMAVEAIRENLHLISEYRFENDLVFRAAIAASFSEELSPAQFITANSGMELLDIIVRGFVREDSEVILSSPTFMAYKNFAMLGGARVVDVPLLWPDYQLDVEGILKAVTINTRLLFISNPNNPSGTLIPGSTMDELMTRLPAHVVVVYDEVYHHYVQSNDYPRALDYIKTGRHVIGLHSFSKAYGLAGLRVGYAFSTPEIAGYLQHIRRPFMINTLSIVSAMAALKDQGHIDATRSLNNTEKTWLCHELDRLGFNYWPSEANFLLLKPGMAAGHFVEYMRKQGVMVRNADVMKAAGCVRVTIGTREANHFFTGLLEQGMFT